MYVKHICDSSNVAILNLRCFRLMESNISLNIKKVNPYLCRNRHKKEFNNVI